jgi:ring-1,2-phenylacetyl-CoA epoxidase subunit PaaC
VTYAVWLGDDALILAQRLAEWPTRAPELEEDIALANIALDLLGQARALFGHAGALEGLGRDEDAFAFDRHEREFRNLQLVEQPNGDFACTIVRQLLFSAYQLALYRRLRDSSDPALAAIAAKAVKEVAYHIDHAVQWTLRLGDGTPESRRRMQLALEQLWPFTAEMFTARDLNPQLLTAGIAVDPQALRPEWEAFLDRVLAEATMMRPAPAAPVPVVGGRQGIHTEAFGYLLAEMQHLHRSYPGARW